MGAIKITFQKEDLSEVITGTRISMADGQVFMNWAKYAYPPEIDPETGLPKPKPDDDYLRDVGNALIKGTLDNVNNYSRQKAAKDAADAVDPVEPE